MVVEMVEVVEVVKVVEMVEMVEGVRLHEILNPEGMTLYLLKRDNQSHKNPEGMTLY